MATKTEAKPADETGPAFKYYKPHPLLAMFPEASEADLAAMERSVLAIGVQQRVRVWTDDKAREWLIDGRTRQAGAERAFRRRLAADPAEATQADNGLPLQPEVEPFAGTLEEVYDFVKTTHVRKHYTPGQKAALGVKLYYYEYKRMHHGRLPDPATEVTQEGAASAVELAERFGCNEYYVRICRQLYRDAPDLLDAVALGALPPPKAAASLKERRAGNEPDAPGEEDETAKGEEKGDGPAADAGAPLLDKDGLEVPESCAEAFQARSVFKTIRTQVMNARRAAEKLAGMPGGEFIDGPTLDAQINTVLKHLLNTEPFKVCSECAGKGKKGRWACARCKETGFVPRMVEKAEAKAAKAEAEKGDEKGKPEKE